MTSARRASAVAEMNNRFRFPPAEPEPSSGCESGTARPDGRGYPAYFAIWRISGATSGPRLRARLPRVKIGENGDVSVGYANFEIRFANIISHQNVLLSGRPCASANILPDGCLSVPLRPVARPQSPVARFGRIVRQARESFFLQRFAGMKSASQSLPLPLMYWPVRIRAIS